MASAHTKKWGTATSARQRNPKASCVVAQGHSYRLVALRSQEEAPFCSPNSTPRGPDHGYPAVCPQVLGEGICYPMSPPVLRPLWEREATTSGPSQWLTARQPVD